MCGETGQHVEKWLSAYHGCAVPQWIKGELHRVGHRSGDAADSTAGPRRPPAGSWRALRPPPYSRITPRSRSCPLHAPLE
ncbi:unnamed protein product, partial [Iphiclides podalirius]